jgi:hypothetical protein
MLKLHRPNRGLIVRVPAADSDYRDALAFVNDLRVRFGHAPLMAMRPGRVGDSARCPIAQSLIDVFPSVFVDTGRTSYACKADGAFVSALRHPGSVMRFVRRVDAHYFPTLLTDQED